MATYIVFLDKKNKWHCWEESTLGHPSTPLGKETQTHADRSARTTARLLAGNRSMGTADFIGSAQVAYCIHARRRHHAIKTAKVAFAEHKKRRRLK